MGHFIRGLLIGPMAHWSYDPLVLWPISISPTAHCSFNQGMFTLSGAPSTTSHLDVNI